MLRLLFFTPMEGAKEHSSFKDLVASDKKSVDSLAEVLQGVPSKAFLEKLTIEIENKEDGK